MNRDGGDPLCTRVVLGHNALLLEIVLEDLHVGTSEEMRLGWVETNGLNDTLRLSEWPRGVGTRQAVDHNLAGGLDVVRHGGKVVSLRVPNNLADDSFEVHRNHMLTKTAVFAEFPGDELLFLVTGFGVNIVLSFPFLHGFLKSIAEALRIQLGLKNIDELLVCHSQEAILLAWRPFNTINDSVLELVLPQDSCRIDIPYHNIMIFISRGKVLSTW